MTTYKRTDRVFDCNLADASILFHGGVLEYFQVSGAAKDIWDALASWQSEDWIVEHLTSIYDVESEVCREGVNQFLQALKAEDLIVSKDE